MGRNASSIKLTDAEREYLELQTRARTIQAQTVARARILLLKADGISIDEIADKVGINRKSVMLCLKKYRYYCENRDPDFDAKMHNVLLVYKQFSLQFDEDGNLLPFPGDGQTVHVLPP